MSLAKGLSKGLAAVFSTRTPEGTLEEAPKGFSKKLSKGFFEGLSRRFAGRTSEETLGGIL